MAKKSRDEKETSKNNNDENLPDAAATFDTDEKKQKNENENQTELDAAEQLYRELFDRYQRSIAEFDNYRKRTIKEKLAAYDEGVRDTIEKLLPVIDNFERALSAVENTDDAFYQGIAMIARQMHSFLTDIGVVAISSVNEQFNVNLHHAVAHVEDEDLGSNIVIEKLQKGYIYKEKVVRTSMVKVAN